MKNLFKGLGLGLLVLVLVFGVGAGRADAVLTATATTLTSDGVLTLTGAAASTWSTSAGALTITSAAAATWSTAAGALSIDSAAALNLGNTTATAVSLCNSATCDTITIGSNADADTITIGDSTDTTVSITDDNWSVTAAGLATFVNALVSPSATLGLDVGSAGALSLGNVTATSVSVCNSAACDTLALASNADADAITLGDSLDTTTMAGILSVTAGGSIVSSVSNLVVPFMPTVVQQDLSGAGAVNLTTYYTAVTNGGAEALTLADSTVKGQLKKVQMIVDGGASTLTFNTDATIVFADAGDYAVLMWNGSDWLPVELGNDADGATAPAYTPAS